MSTGVINSVKTISNHQTFIQKYGWTVFEHGYDTILFKAKLNATGALVVTHSMRIDLQLNLAGYVYDKKVMEMKPTQLTFDKLLVELKKLEKSVVNRDPTEQPSSVALVPVAAAGQGHQINTAGTSDNVSNQAQVAQSSNSAAVVDQNYNNIPKSKGTTNNLEQCRSCNRSFLSKEGLQSHMAVSHGPIYKCGLCKNRFPSERILDRHVLNCNKRRRIESPESNSSNSAANLYSCVLCQKQFGSRYHLEEHEKYHTQEFAARLGGFESEFGLPANGKRWF